MNRLYGMAILGFVVAGCGGGGGGSPAPAHAQELTTTSSVVVRDLILTSYTASDTDGVQGVSCPVDAKPVSAGCHCTIPQAGDIFGMSVIGNGAVCGCSLGTDSDTDDRIDVSVVCLRPVMANALTGATLSKLDVADGPAPWDEALSAKVAALDAMRR